MSTPQTLLQSLPPHQHLDHQRYLPSPQERLLPPPRPSSNLSNGYYHNIPTRPSSNLSNRQLPPPRPESGMSNGGYVQQAHSQPRSAAEYAYNTNPTAPSHPQEEIARTNSTSSQQNRYLPPPSALTSRAAPPPPPVADYMPAEQHDGRQSAGSAHTPRKRRQRAPVDWVAFYGGRPPAEIIEIHDDDSPAPPATIQHLPPATTGSIVSHHVDKRRRIDRRSQEAPAYSTTNTPYSYNGNSAESILTAATSLASTSSGSRFENVTQTGQKRKRIAAPRAESDRATQDLPGHANARGYLAEYGEYVPPPKQARKQKEVPVPVVNEVSLAPLSPVTHLENVSKNDH